MEQLENSNCGMNSDSDHGTLLSRKGYLFVKGSSHSVHPGEPFPVKLEVLLCNDKWKRLRHQSIADSTHYPLLTPRPPSLGQSGPWLKLYFSLLSVSHKDSVYGSLTFNSQLQPAAKDSKYTLKS